MVQTCQKANISGNSSRKFCWTLKKIIMKNVDGSHWLFFPILWKSMDTVNILVTKILQNILFCAHRGLGHLEGDYMIWMNYPFKIVFVKIF